MKQLLYIPCANKIASKWSSCIIHYEVDLLAGVTAWELEVLVARCFISTSVELEHIRIRSVTCWQGNIPGLHLMKQSKTKRGCIQHELNEPIHWETLPF